MNKLKLKTTLIEVCIETQNKTIDNARASMKDAFDSANEYGLPEDRFDPFKDQLLKKRDLSLGQLQKAKDDINILQKIDLSEEYDNVRFGSVVITNHQKMFVSISMGKITVNGDSYFTISPNVPIFKVMNGLKKGDSFQFNSKNLIIEEVY